MMYGVETVAENPRSRIRGNQNKKRKGGKTQNKMAELKTLVKTCQQILNCPKIRNINKLKENIYSLNC